MAVRDEVSAILELFVRINDGTELSMVNTLDLVKTWVQADEVWLIERDRVMFLAEATMRINLVGNRFVIFPRNAHAKMKSFTVVVGRFFLPVSLKPDLVKTLRFEMPSPHVMSYALNFRGISPTVCIQN